jgi:hypothetical protein
LDAVAKRFVDSGFDVKTVIRDLVNSRTYQFSAIPNQYNQSDRQNFSRFFPKRLPAEVLYDGLNTVTRSNAGFVGMPAETKAISLPDNSFNKDSYFLTVFGRPESSSACECERSQDASIAQALHLLNAKGIQEKLSSSKGSAALWAADTRKDEEVLQELYLTAYARNPSPEEVRRQQEEEHMAAIIVDDWYLDEGENVERGMAGGQAEEEEEELREGDEEDYDDEYDLDEVW